MTIEVLTKGDLVDFRLLTNKIMRSHLVDSSDLINLRKVQEAAHKLWKDPRIPEESGVA